MEIKIQSIHFDATEKLQEFIEKKVAKLEKTFEDIKTAEVQLKVVKPATAQNKETSLTVAVPGQTLFRGEDLRHFRGGSRPLRGRNEGAADQIQRKIT